jgi:hypothetical protein
MQKCLESRQSNKKICKKNSIISEIKLLEEFCTISIKEIKYIEVWGNIISALGANVIKLFWSVTYRFFVLS